MNCQKCKVEIDERDLRRDSLSGAAAAHLETCESCRIFCEERLALRRLVGELEKFPAPADFDFRVRARMAAEMSARTERRGWFNFAPAALSWPLAGSLALIIFASLYLQQRQASTPAPLKEQVSASSPTPEMVEVEKNRIERINVTAPRPSITPLTVKISLPQRRRILPERVVKVNRPMETATTEITTEESNSSDIIGAPVRFAAAGTAKVEREMIPVQLTVPERPLKVLLRDPEGVERTISVDSVSFGSRDVIGRAATFKNASLSSNQGVW